MAAATAVTNSTGGAEIAVIGDIDASCGGLSRRELANTISELNVERVTSAGTRQRFRELIDRHHPLGYKVPFGAHLQYLVWIQRPAPAVAGCPRPDARQRPRGDSGQP